MILKGSEGIAYLANQVILDDPSASSHWKYYHSNFQFKNGEFKGLQGFGGSDLPYVGLKKLLHFYLQKPYRDMAIDYASFDKIDKSAQILTLKTNRAYDLDVLRQSISLAFLKNHLPNLDNKATVCVIGDGFASMTSLLLANKFAKRVIIINLTKTLLVDLYYLRLWLGETIFDKVVSLYTGENGGYVVPNEDDANSIEIIAIQAKDFRLLESIKIDLFINIASMQEMNNDSILNYFLEIRKAALKNPTYFYCCNREEKTLPDGSISRFLDYPWKFSDELIVDELVPWHQKYYRLSIPFYKSFDGPVRHRLAKMSKI
jgi:putative sugar O-methyltransferase